ncbi:MAG TPA: TonB family protein [Pyrinomonadaceae bacterium]|nr:TonB family protein [Pyrinomonadaceae bacterium]
MRHDCEATNERLVDLVFGEIEGADRGALLEEVVRCEACARRYRTMAETLRVFDEAAEALLPDENFWTGYEERLRTRMAQEIQTDFWRQAAFPFARGEYHLTFVEDDGLARRLVRQLKSVAQDAELTWPEFRRDPFGFAHRSVGAYGQAGLAFFSQRNVALATLASFVFISLLLGSVFALGRLHGRELASANPYDNLQVVGYVDENGIPRDQEKSKEGTAGTETGKGGGSKPQYERPHGGGGGGRDEQLQASAGKLPTAQLVPPIVTANPKPPAVDAHLPTPATVDVDPMLIKPDTRDIAYGDPKSTSTTPSSGPGHGGGMGDGRGGGVGPGDGGGVGPGRGGNIGGGDREEGGGGRGGGGEGGAIDYNRPFNQRDVTQRALITFKPEPSFTEDARKNNVTGLVRLRAVLSASGEVLNVSVVKGLPDGLTEKAIEAAKQIKFRPAQKDGHTVSQYVTLEYNFNIY